jgi:hypothetical protein
MVAKEKVNVKLQLISLIFTITALIGFAHIKKLQKGLALIGIILAINISMQILLPFPFGLLVGLAISYSILFHFMLKWSKQWNEDVDRSSKPII